MPVIVTDGLWRKSLSAVRSLGKSGYEVWVLSDTILAPALWSNFTSRKIRTASACSDATAFGRTIFNLPRTEELRILIPMEDASMRWASHNRQALEDARIKVLLPPQKSLDIAFSKELTQKHASEIGIQTPRTSPASNPELLYRETKDLDPGTFIVKPSEGSGSSGVKYTGFSSISEASEYIKMFGSALVQERIPSSGRAVGVSALYRNGNLVASFTHERIHQYPVSGGPSTYRVSISEPDIELQSHKLLKSLAWNGVAMVEWKLNPQNNLPYLMEINPRFWGSLELAQRAGLNFPDLYCRAAMDLQPGELSYQTGVKCRWLIPGDILRYISTPSQKRESLTIFLRGILSESEEFDSEDVSGSLATIWCTILNAFNPKYWKYLRR